MTLWGLGFNEDRVGGHFRLSSNPQNTRLHGSLANRKALRRPTTKTWQPHFAKHHVEYIYQVQTSLTFG